MADEQRENNKLTARTQPKHTRGDLQQMQSLPLSAKVAMTKRRVNHFVHMKLQQLLCDAPAADVREVRRGKWENSKSGLDFIRCSECHAVYDRITKYCPHCGAKMDE